MDNICDMHACMQHNCDQNRKRISTNTIMHIAHQIVVIVVVVKSGLRQNPMGIAILLAIRGGYTYTLAIYNNGFRTTHIYIFFLGSRPHVTLFLIIEHVEDV